MTKKESGKLGGLKTLEKYGKEYFKTIGRNGGIAMNQKYYLLPVDLYRFAIINRITGEFVKMRNS